MNKLLNDIALCLLECSQHKWIGARELVTERYLRIIATFCEYQHQGV